MKLLNFRFHQIYRTCEYSINFTEFNLLINECDASLYGHNIQRYLIIFRISDILTSESILKRKRQSIFCENFLKDYHE